MKINFYLFSYHNVKFPIGKIQLDNNRASIVYSGAKEPTFDDFEDFDAYSYKPLPHLCYESYFEGEEITKKSYKKRKFNYSFEFLGGFDGDGYSSSQSGYCYLNLFQRIRLKYFHGKGWWQQDSNINKFIVAPIIVSAVAYIFSRL